MGPTPVAQPLLLTVEGVFVRPVVREFFGGARDVCAVNDGSQDPFTLIKSEFSLHPVPNQLHSPWRDVNPYPLSTEFLCRDTGGRTATERV